MTETPKETWDLEAVYDSEIAPLMTKIIAVCKEHRLPMLATFAYANDVDEAQYCTTSLPFEGRNLDELSHAARTIRSGVPGRFAAFTITTQEPRR